MLSVPGATVQAMSLQTGEDGMAAGLTALTGEDVWVVPAEWTAKAETETERLPEGEDALEWVRRKRLYGVAYNDVLRPVLYQLATQAGPAAAPVIAAHIAASYTESAYRMELAEVLAYFPTDEAFALLLERICEPGVIVMVMRAASRFPRRALRMLTDAICGVARTPQAVTLPDNSSVATTLYFAPDAA
jgi:hypothetical protein